MANLFDISNTIAYLLVQIIYSFDGSLTVLQSQEINKNFENFPSNEGIWSEFSKSVIVQGQRMWVGAF